MKFLLSELWCIRGIGALSLGSDTVSNQPTRSPVLAHLCDVLVAAEVSSDPKEPAALVTLVQSLAEHLQSGVQVHPDFLKFAAKYLPTAASIEHPSYGLSDVGQAYVVAAVSPFMPLPPSSSIFEV